MFYRQCIANDVANSMLLYRAFCQLLAVGRLLHWDFCWFWLFLRDLNFLDNHGNPKRCPQKVRDKWRALNKAVLNNLDQLTIHILETTNTGEDLRVTRLISNSGVSFRNRSEFWIAIVLSMLTVVVTMSYLRLNLNFRKIYSSSNVSIKRMVSVPENSIPSQHSRQSRSRLSSPFYRHLGCWNAEKWVNNFKCGRSTRI